MATVAAAPPASMEAATATLTRPATAQELAPPQANGFASELPQEEAKARGTDTFRAAIHMDAMAFGMGCCCLQVTFQAKDIDESRFMYDLFASNLPGQGY